MRRLLLALAATLLVATAASAAPTQSEIQGHWVSTHGSVNYKIKEGGIRLDINPTGHWIVVSDGTKIPRFNAQGDGAMTKDFAIDWVQPGVGYLGQMTLHLRMKSDGRWEGVWEWPPDYEAFVVRLFPQDSP